VGNHGLVLSYLRPSVVPSPFKAFSPPLSSLLPAGPRVGKGNGRPSTLWGKVPLFFPVGATSTVYQFPDSRVLSLRKSTLEIVPDFDYVVVLFYPC